MTYGLIYKITNDINNKFYIGQTIGTIQSRFNRHIADAVGERKLDTHLARAIRKYGKEHFHIKLIDSAENQNELTQKEYFWIRTTNAIRYGYNETDALFKCGGNTYRSKSEIEMDKIKNKISESNSKGNNGNARPVKVKNIETGEELFFDSISSLQEYFKIKHHVGISRRCKHIIEKPLLGQWYVSYAEYDYDDTDVLVKKHDIHVGSRNISVFDRQTKQTCVYESYRDFERKNNLKIKTISSKTPYKKGDVFLLKDRYEITLLN